MLAHCSERVPEASEPALGSVKPHAPRVLTGRERDQKLLLLFLSAEFVDVI